MHEVVYLQLGNLPNFIGTHFWNAQNAYTEEEVDHSISWSIREKTSGIQGDPVLRPRAMIFDKRNNFGPLQNLSLDVDGDPSEASDAVQNWDGPTQTIAKAQIPPSSYLTRLEAETAPRPGNDDEETETAPRLTEVRYWSDYNHVYFTRDSLHPVPITGEDDNVVTGWADGTSMFEAYDRENDIMDESLRRLTEDCDSLQAFQTTLHTPSFGPFGVTLLQRIVDEYPKCGKLNFSISGNYASIWDVKKQAAQTESGGLLSNTLALYHLSQLSDVCVPLLPHTMWQSSKWQDLVPGLQNVPYHLSALYAAHIESVTWPIRQQKAGRGFDSIVQTLNREGITPFACLNGIFPAPANGFDETYFDHRLELSLPKAKHSQETGLLARYTVIRTSPTSEPLIPINTLHTHGISDRNEVIHVRNPYPIPTSHPQFFAASTLSDERGRGLAEANVYSSLNVLGAFGKVLGRHADWAEGYVRRGGDLRSAGIESDEAQEAIEGMRAIIEAYREDESEAAGSGDL